MQRYRRLVRIGSAFAAVAVLLVIGWLWLAIEPAQSERVAAALVPAAANDIDFNLVNHEGRGVAPGDFEAPLLIVLFGYTHCPDVCPTTLTTLSAVLDELGDRAALVQPLFVTVDPERDTPEVLATYVAAFDPRIVGLTGTLAQVRAAASAFRVHFARSDQTVDYLVDHSAAFYLVAPTGRVLAYFGHDESASVIEQGVRRVMDWPG